MNTFKKLLFLILFILMGNIAFSQEIDNNSTIKNSNLKIINKSSPTPPLDKTIAIPLEITDTTLFKQDVEVYPSAAKDYKRLGYNTGMFLGATVVAFGALYAMPESVTNWDKAAMKENGITYKWKENLKAGPVWDYDNWVLNYITHPYSGGIYYMTARSSGFTRFESFLYSAFMSTFFWEYGIEAFAEIPSIQDLVITPLVGSMVGEGLFYAKKSIVKHDRKVLNSKVLGTTTLFLIDPFNTILDGFGYKERQSTQLNVAPIGFDNGTNKAIWGLNFNMQF